MNAEEQESIRNKRHSRIRLVKKILRPLPRKAMIHRYPVLKYFASTARKRSYLWSFKQRHVIRSIYSGCVLSLLPIYGLQIIAGFIAALALRSNLMVMIALQFITNPVTAVPLYILCFQVGAFCLDPFYADPPDIEISVYITSFMQEVQSMLGLSEIVKDVPPEALSKGDDSAIHIFVYSMFSMIVGGIVLGLLLAFILTFIYRWLSRRAAGSYRKLQEQRQRKQEEKKNHDRKE